MAQIEQIRRQIGETASAMLSGELSFIEGARRISELRFEAKLDFDPHILPFVAIDSETDALPLGKVRDLWASDALTRLQPKIDEAERWARQIGSLPCQTLVALFTNSEITPKP